MKAFVKRITDSHIEVRCENCRAINHFTRQHTDEGKYEKRCYKCNMKMTFIVDKHAIFRDLGGDISGRSKMDKNCNRYI